MKGNQFIRIVAGLILIFVGIAWYLYPCCREWAMQKDVDAVLAGFGEYDASDMQSPEDAAEDMPLQSQAPVLQGLYAEMSRYNDGLAAGGQQITDAWDFEQAPVDLSALGSGTSAIGCIEVPDMDVRMPLYIGASKSNLSKGAAVLAGTSMPIGGSNTNCVICGHRGWKGSAYFRNIENMKTGSIVYITNPWGTLTYKAVSAKIIHKSEVDAILIQPGKDMVTLFSCYPYGQTGTPYRYVVFCERIQPDGAEQEAGTDVKEPLTVEGVKAGEHMTEDENKIILWEQILRYALPAVVGIAALVCLVRRKNPKEKNRR